MKKLISIILALTMICGWTVVPALAADDNDGQTVIGSEQATCEEPGDGEQITDGGEEGKATFSDFIGRIGDFFSLGREFIVTEVIAGPFFLLTVIGLMLISPFTLLF